MGFIDDLGQLAYNIYQAAVVAEGIEDAVETMSSMVGNVGQEVILINGIEGFTEWAVNGADGDIDSSTLGISGEAFDGSSEIWNEGAEIVRSAYEDAGLDTDEGGESSGDGDGGFFGWVVDVFTDVDDIVSEE